MSYKHQERIKNLLSAKSNRLEMFDELDEVYRKAQAFDEINQIIGEIIDLKLGMKSKYNLGFESLADTLVFYNEVNGILNDYINSGVESEDE